MFEFGFEFESKLDFELVDFELVDFKLDKRSCGTLSKALERSKKMMSVCCERFLVFAQSL